MLISMIFWFLYDTLCAYTTVYHPDEFKFKLCEKEMMRIF